MTEVAHTFADSDAYERFMGRWSRAVGPQFLDWVSAPTSANWLDVGCGTGILTELIFEHCTPAAVFGIDPQRAQIEYAKRQPIAQRATLRVANAEALPFSDAAFDVVASALAINFVADRARAASEMRRVARPGGIVAGFVWDFEAEQSPSWPLRVTMRKCGAEVPGIPGTDASSLRALTALFEEAGLHFVETTTMEVTLSYQDFDAFLDAQTPSYSPTTRVIAAMSAREREKLLKLVRAALPTNRDGAIEYAALANAVKARV
ncbi:MAG: class I SAM-dependent methyltransferase [Pseudomonadota bacterium]